MSLHRRLSYDGHVPLLPYSPHRPETRDTHESTPLPAAPHRAVEGMLGGGAPDLALVADGDDQSATGRRWRSATASAGGRDAGRRAARRHKGRAGARLPEVLLLATISPSYSSCLRPCLSSFSSGLLQAITSSPLSPPHPARVRSVHALARWCRFLCGRDRELRAATPFSPSRPTMPPPCQPSVKPRPMNAT